jgi:glycolate oxidase iron-sulfur subunit
MPSLPEIERLRDEAEKCVACGLCLQACPVYAIEPMEDYVSRGRNLLLKEFDGESGELTAGSPDRFSKCLLCRRCTAACPQGIRTDLLTVAARAEVVRHEGLPVVKKTVFQKLMKDKKSLSGALRWAARLQSMLPRTSEADDPVHHLPSHEAGKIRHLPWFVPGLAGRQFPAIAGKFLGEQIGMTQAPAKGGDECRLRVAFFPGCATEFSLPEVGKALIGALSHLGVEVVYAQDQSCCGIPLLAAGDLETARRMALHNLGIFADLEVDLVVTGCATCGSTLKEGWADNLARSDAERQRFEAFGASVRDISELLLELAEYKPLPFRSALPEGTRVTYHEPCHLAFHQGVREQPRQILRQVFGERFSELDDGGCCGFGGAFSLEHFELSKKIAESKVRSIARSEADVVVTGCPGCLVQLIDNIERHGLGQRVVHISEAITPDRKSGEN